MDLNIPSINQLLDKWLDEDLGRGDLTRAALSLQRVEAYWIAKQPGVLCAGCLVEQLFKRLDPSVQVKLLVNDGEHFQANQRLIEVNGPSQTLVAGERTALNLVMHLSGISTTTATLVKELEGTGVHLADTRKTTPGLRILEKYAVRCGGGMNHRLGLDDAAMLKENHLAWASDISTAVKAVRASAPWPSSIIVEAETALQAEQAVQAGVDGILLDEMSPETLHNLVPKLRELAAIENNQRKSNQIVIEASGVEPRHLRKYAATGVDLISTSAPVTRSHWIDISMRFKSIGDENSSVLNE